MYIWITILIFWNKIIFSLYENYLTINSQDYVFLFHLYNKSSSVQRDGNYSLFFRFVFLCKNGRIKRSLTFSTPTVYNVANIVVPDINMSSS